MTTVRLTEMELSMAAHVAFIRQIVSMRKGYTPRWGDVNRGWLNNLLGAFGEAAAAKYLGVYWGGGNNDIRASDVGDYEVRYNSYGDKAYLRINDQDKPAKKYILVTGEPPEFKLQGWLLGSEGMRQEYRDTPLNNTPGKDCYWVPISKLNPMSEL